MSESLESDIATAAVSPKSASVDGNSVNQHPLGDQIEADKYLAAKRNATAKRVGIRFAKLKPPGTI